MNFTEDWHPPQAPTERTVLRPSPAGDDPRVIGALEEYLAAAEAGRVPDRAEFLARHADVAEPLARCLDGLEFVHAGVPRLQSPDLPAASEPAPDIVLGDYRIQREVGRGGMGIVYEAEQQSLKRRVALKVLPFAATLDPRQLQRFQTEARAAAHLHHTNIVPVFAVGCEQGVHYYAMQFIEGRNLAAVIEDLRREGEKQGSRDARPSILDPRSSIDPRVPQASTREQAAATERSVRGTAFLRSVANWGVQAAEALEHAHQLGIVHRDVKPANLLLDQRGQLWVADFGLALCQGETGLTMTGDLVGTLRYMSPEQALARRGIVDHRTDIYSLGATLYELLTLEPLFRGRDRHELLTQIALEEPRLPRHLNRAVPPPLETVVLKALAKDPARRYASAREMADDLRRFLDDRPVLARRPSLGERAGRWARRYRTALAALASLLGLALVTLAVSVLVMWFQTQQTREETAQAEAKRLLAERETNRANRETERANRETGRARKADRAEARAKRRYEHNVRLGLEVLDDRVEQARDRLPRGFTLGPENGLVLEQTLAFYQEFLRKNRRHPRARREVARGYDRVGRLQFKLGHFRQARRTLWEGIAFLDRLIEKSPRDWALLEMRANMHQYLGQACRSLGRTRDAERAYRRSLALWKQLDTYLPRSARRPKLVFQVLRAETMSWLGVLLSDAGRNDEAEATFAQCRALCEKLVRKAPHDPSPVFGLAHCRLNQGSLFNRTRRPRLALRAYRAAEKRLAKLVGDDPTVSYFRDDLAACRFNLGRMLVSQQPKAAEIYLRSAAGIYERLAGEFPGVFNYQQLRGRAYGSLALLLKSQTRLAEARAALVLALRGEEAALRINPSHPDTRHSRCVSYYTLARLQVQMKLPRQARHTFERALDLAEALARDFPASDRYRRVLPQIVQRWADFLGEVKELARAGQWYQREARLWGQLAEDFPREPEYRALQGEAWRNAAATRYKTGRLRATLRADRRAVALCAGLAGRQPPAADLRYDLARALGNLVHTLDKEGRWAECRVLAEKAVRQLRLAFRLKPEVARNGITLQKEYDRLVSFWVKLKDHAGAARVAAEMSAAVPSPFSAAAAWKHLRACEGLAARDGRLPQGERKARARAYARQADAMERVAVRRCGGSLTSQSTLAWVLATHVDPECRCPALAVKLARQVADRVPKVPEVREILGVALYRTGDWKAAITELERALQLRKGGTSTVWFFLAMARWQRDHQDPKAKEAYQAGLRLLAQEKSVDKKTRGFQAEAARLLGVKKPRAEN
jgi:serine/threonine protein kinase